MGFTNTAVPFPSQERKAGGPCCALSRIVTAVFASLARGIAAALVAVELAVLILSRTGRPG
jgi:hypothetical protein